MTIKETRNTAERQIQGGGGIECGKSGHRYPKYICGQCNWLHWSSHQSVLRIHCLFFCQNAFCIAGRVSDFSLFHFYLSQLFVSLLTTKNRGLTRLCCHLSWRGRKNAASQTRLAFVPEFLIEKFASFVSSSLLESGLTEKYLWCSVWYDSL